MGRKIVVEVNQQQRQMLDRLVAEGTHGSTHADVLRSGFLEFCRLHPEIVGAQAAKERS
jgi:hypothetical protein